MIRIARYVLLPALVGVLALGSAWAGTGLAPVDLPDPLTPEDIVADGVVANEPTARARTFDAESSSVATLIPSPTGLYAGAHKVSIYPEPPEGRVWEQDPGSCATLSPEGAFGHMGDLERSPWPENTDCIYTGGYDIGPVNAVSDFDTEYGLWARSVALSDGEDTLVLTVIDGVYWFGEYGTMCDGCGAFDLQEQLGAELGIDPDGLIFTATHSHTAPDFIGGWGGVPDWYMEQAAEAMRESVRQAVLGLEPATLEYGEVLARQHNNERRNTYRSAEEAGLSWLRALPVQNPQQGAIATVGAYAAHPTTVGKNDRIAHPDWPGIFNVRAEERFGGVGAHFMTGLGNMSARGGRDIGHRLADMLPDPGRGITVGNPDIRFEQVHWQQPVTNSVLLSLGGGGFFDRPFSGPASVSDGKSEMRPCVSASPVSVQTGVSAARIGELVLTAAPGEIFSNYSNAVKERYPDTVVFPLGMANDAMGYIMQSFETFDEARQGLGFSSSLPEQRPHTEYEDAYSIDRCFGDVALETTLRLLNDL